MIQAVNLDELEALLSKAKAKAESVRPYVTIDKEEFGHYKVESSKGTEYDVWAGKTETGDLFIACTCRGGLEGKACYHASRIFPIHTAIAKGLQKKTIDPADAPYLKQTSKKKPERIGNIRIN